jgi:hypothetical protein
MERQHYNNKAPMDQSMFHGAMIDSHGNEIEITEKMIQKACDALEESATSFIPHTQNPQP